MALAICQVTMGTVLALWLSRLLLLIGLLMVVNVTLAGWLAAGCTNDNIGNWLGIMVIIAGLVAIPIGAVRLAGGRLVTSDDQLSVGKRERQFTIFGLFSLTTVVGLALGLGRFLDFPWKELGQIGLFVLAIGAIPWVAAPLALSRAPLWLPLVATAVVCPLVGWAISKTGFPPDQPRELIAMTCLQGALTLGICAVVRVAGYRLAWPQ